MESLNHKRREIGDVLWWSSVADMYIPAINTKVCSMGLESVGNQCFTA